MGSMDRPRGVWAHSDLTVLTSPNLPLLRGWQSLVVRSKAMEDPHLGDQHPCSSMLWAFAVGFSCCSLLSFAFSCTQPSFRVAASLLLLPTCLLDEDHAQLG